MEECAHPYHHVEEVEAELSYDGQTVDTFPALYCDRCGDVFSVDI